MTFVKTVAKATSKGQVTLPAKWRKLFETDRFVMQGSERVLEIRPLDIDAETEGAWTTVFDAERDNEGKPVKGKELAALLRKMA
jgi:bifunctional DNA-binding transcriptional regulator/antitoxin component of YhaV-PrlF toxin-antitoxin module